MERIQVQVFNAKLDGNTLSGTAHAYGQRTLVNGRYESFAQGSFTDVLHSDATDVRAFFNHNPDYLLGRQKAGTLTISDAKEGLDFSINLPDTTYANDLKELINRGDLDGCSFGFIPGKSVRTFAEDGLPVRTHTSAKELIDISVVSLPAFSGTRLSLRSKTVGEESVKSQLARARHRARSNHEYRRTSSKDGLHC